MGYSIDKNEEEKNVAENYLEENQCLSPCTGNCKLENDFCLGCGRSRQQIVSWKNTSREERIRIMKNLRNLAREA